MPSVELAHPADFAGWRAAARGLLARAVPPEEVAWRVTGEPSDLLADQPVSEAAPASPIAVPRELVELAGHAVLHRDRDRFALLYRLLWRVCQDRRLIHFAADPDLMRVAAMAKAVRRDIHKTHAFVRFRAVVADSEESFVAWHEPDHHTLEASAPFFMRRFANMRWAILTPGRSALWDGRELAFGPGAGRTDAPGGDSLEEVWRAYYASIFNPARVNPGAMRAEMPKHFWRNLPEAPLIGPLIRNASRKERAMIATQAKPAVRRRGAELPEPTPEQLGGDTLDEVRRAAEGCRACPLWEHATQTVFGEGPAGAPVMLVGEQPGDVEDIQGRPFVGPAGRLLDRALGELSIDRRRLYVTNAVKHFKFVPRGKRRIHQKPGSSEIRACGPWLERELELVNPKLVVLMGATAVQAGLGRASSITSLRGKVIPFGQEREATVTVHPSFLLRLPEEADRDEAYGAFLRDLRLLLPYLD